MKIIYILVTFEEQEVGKLAIRGVRKKKQCSDMLIVFFFLIYMNKVEEGEGSYSHNATLANTSLKKKFTFENGGKLGRFQGEVKKKN